MSRLAITALAIAFALAAALSATEPASSDTRLITVTGHAEVKVVPDQIRLALGVETFDVNIAAAKKANYARVRAVLTATEQHGVERRHVQTDFLEIEPRYKDRHTRSELLGYAVSKRIVVHLEDTSQFEPLLSGVLEAGVSNVHGISFHTSELRGHRDRARALALEAAEEKARAMAGQLGQDVGRPHSIKEGSLRSWYGSEGVQNVMQDAGMPPVDLEGLTPGGQISINAEVTVSFELREAG